MELLSHYGLWFFNDRGWMFMVLLGWIGGWYSSAFHNRWMMFITLLVLALLCTLASFGKYLTS